MSLKFCQIVIGPPGSGKTAYCYALLNFLKNRGRDCSIINLDPGCGSKYQDCNVDIRDLITVDKVMKELMLGPNGALLYCMEFLYSNKEWLFSRLSKLKDDYIIFDCPGQLELYSLEESLKYLLLDLSKENYNVVVTNVVDITHCGDACACLSSVLESLAVKMHLEQPQVNVLSKIDLINKINAIKLPIEFYFDFNNLKYLKNHLEDSHCNKLLLKFSDKMISILEDYNSMLLIPFSVHDDFCISDVLKECDRANGYVISAYKDVSAEYLNSLAYVDSKYERLNYIREKYFSYHDE